MDTVFITELRIETIIGIHDRERNLKQPVTLDLEMDWNNQGAAATDNISQACDYESISTRITQFIADSEFKLIETLAEETARLVLTEFAVPRLVLTVSKPEAITNARSVGVRIERPPR